MRNLLKLLPAPILLLCCAACAGGGGSAAVPVQRVPGLNSSTHETPHAGVAGEAVVEGSPLSIHDASFVESGQVEALQLSWETGPDGQIAVICGRPAGLKALVGSLRYAPARLTPAGLRRSPAWSSSSLEFTHWDEPGLVQFSIVEPPSAPGLSAAGSIELLRIEFDAGPFALRTVSAAHSPPLDSAWAAELGEDSSGELRLFHNMEGDYDQNGEVNAADLVPLGRSYGAWGPYFGEYGHLRVVDGNRDNLLNISDIVPIGRNFGSRVSAYRFYSSQSSSDYPAQGLSANGPGSVLLADLLFSGLTIDPKWGNATASLGAPQPFTNYWVRPVYKGQEGIASARWGEDDLHGGFLATPFFPIPESYGLDGMMSNLEITTNELENGTELLLHGDAANLHSIAFRVGLDKGKRRLTEIEINQEFLSTAQCSQFCLDDADAVIVFALHYRPLESETFSGTGLLLARLQFADEPSTGDLPLQDKVLPRDPIAGDPLLSFDNEAMALRWLYNLPMDGRQHGFVNIDSYTLLGFYMNEAVESSIDLRLLMDGNEDGVITYWDVHWFMYHFNSIHGGFNIYRSVDPLDYPADAEQAAEREPFAERGTMWTGIDQRQPYSLKLEEADRGFYYWITGAGYLSDMVHVPAQ